MDNEKTKGVMTALKGRKGFGSKKGVALLGIVQKLTKKREEMKKKKKDGSGGPGVSGLYPVNLSGTKKKSPFDTTGSASNYTSLMKKVEDTYKKQTNPGLSPMLPKQVKPLPPKQVQSVPGSLPGKYADFKGPIPAPVDRMSHSDQRKWYENYKRTKKPNRPK